MIRVIARHIDDLEGILVGDFHPSEIPNLRGLLIAERVYLSAEHDDATFDSFQFIPGRDNQRLVLEALFED